MKRDFFIVHVLMMISYLSLACSSVIVNSSLWQSEPSNPDLLIPGDGGSRIYARLNRSSTQHWFCSKKTADWYTMWLNYEPFFMPPEFTCLMDNAHLVYDEKTGTYHNVPGFETKMDPIGSLDGSSYLDDMKMVTYFGKIVNHLKNERGYTNDNLKAYSYDWRYTPVNARKVSVGEFAMIKQLVEELYVNNNNQRVVILTHSLGGVLTQAFLEYKPKSWKDKYIKNWVSIATPLFGATAAVESFASGYNLGQFIIPNFKLRRGLRSWPSTAWLLPYALYWDLEPIILTPTRNYTASWADLETFFDDIHWSRGKMMFRQLRSFLRFKHPEVNITCVYGSGQKTPAQFYYAGGLPDDKYDPVVFYGDGDGTVSLNSARGCLKWNEWKTEYHVTDSDLKSVQHVDLLIYQGTLDILDQVLGYDQNHSIEFF